MEDDELIAWLTAVDQGHANKGVPIPQRPMRAWAELAKRLQIPIRLVSPKMIPPDYPQPGDREVLLLYGWYDQQYGKRLGMGTALGEVAFVLRGDAWIASLPMIFGKCRLYASRTTGDDPVLGTSASPLQHNVLNDVIDLPEQLRSTLTNEELRHVLQVFLLGIKSYSALDGRKKYPLVRAALTDHAATVRHVVKQPRHFGQARWSALQAVEKCLKAVLAAAGKTPPKTHDLRRLVDLATASGLQGVEAGTVMGLQVAADLRYEADTSTMSDAVRSHHLSLRISGDVCAALPST